MPSSIGADEASCTLFDIAGNLRATLDQVGYAAALSGGKQNARRTSFPFSERESDLGRISFGAACETGLGGLDQDFRTHWDSVKRELSLMRARPEIRVSGPTLKFTIAVDSIDDLRGKPLLETLHLLSD